MNLVNRPVTKENKKNLFLQQQVTLFKKNETQKNIVEYLPGNFRDFVYTFL